MPPTVPRLRPQHRPCLHAVPGDLPGWFLLPWRQTAVELRHAGYHRAEDKDFARRKAKDFWTLSILLAGEIDLILATQRRRVLAPCAWLLPPGTPSAHASSGPSEQFHILFTVHGAGGPALRHLAVRCAAMAAELARARCEAIAVNFIGWRARDRVAALRARPELDRLLLDHALAVLAAGAAAPAAAPQPPAWFSDLCLQMVEDMRRPGYGFRDIVAAAGVSPSLVARTFQAQHGLTALGYLRRIRLDFAARLLRDDAEETVSSVAARCGYSSLPLFSRHFTAAYGSSPRTWRQQGVPAE